MNALTHVATNTIIFIHNLLLKIIMDLFSRSIPFAIDFFAVLKYNIYRLKEDLL